MAQSLQRSRAHRDLVARRVAESDAFKPLVLVIASAGAKAAAARNGGLAVEDLLQPFGTVRGSIPIRIKEGARTLQQFGVRFVSAERLMPAQGDAASTDAIDQTLCQVVRRTAPGVGQGLSPAQAAEQRVAEQQLHTVRDIPRFLTRSFSSGSGAAVGPAGRTSQGDLSPWWTAAMTELAEVGLRGQQWDMFSHPILLLYVVASQEPHGSAGPAALASSMLDPRNLPAPMVSGQYNRNVPSMVLVLHDNQAAAAAAAAGASAPDPAKVARKVCAGSGMPAEAVKVLRINSLPPAGTDGQQPDMWTGCMSWSARETARAQLLAAEAPPPSEGPVPNGQRPGGLLAPEDMIEIQKFASDLVQSTVVRQIENRIFSLSGSISKARSGFKNTLKSWWRKPKDSSSSNASRAHSSPRAAAQVLLYESASIESQVRLLADLLFMVQDYDGAYRYYGMVRDDYKVSVHPRTDQFSRPRLSLFFFFLFPPFLFSLHDDQS